jgi:hypothetical protein
MKKTALDWLIDEHFGGMENCTPDFKNKINQAKEMEKDQICIAYVYGSAYGIHIKDGLHPINYYNETYNQ